MVTSELWIPLDDFLVNVSHFRANQEECHTKVQDYEGQKGRGQGNFPNLLLSLGEKRWKTGEFFILLDGWAHF